MDWKKKYNKKCREMAKYQARVHIAVNSMDSYMKQLHANLSQYVHSFNSLLALCIMVQNNPNSTEEEIIMTKTILELFPKEEKEKDMDALIDKLQEILINGDDVNE